VPLRPSLPAPGDRGDRGFALIIVLWTLVLIGFIVAHLTANGRTEVRIAGNLVSNAAAQAAADGAIYEAIFNLSEPNPDRRWPVDGIAREIAVGGSRVMVRVEDEASWINPSSASAALLDGLLRITGSDPEGARQLTAAIGDWVGLATTPRAPDTLLAEYRASGLDYGPPGSPLETLDELARVLGMTPSVFAAIRPHLTLFGPPEPNPASSDPVVAAAVALARQGNPASAIPNQTPPDLLTVRITAVASGPANAHVVRSAVVRTGAVLPRGYSVLAWGPALNADEPTVARLNR
jgi:general secretion pathway protein K